jgi:DNA-binding NarL/FixJ family response regulator
MSVIAGFASYVESSTHTIIFLTQNQDREIMSEALSIGHARYVLKSKAASELLHAIEAALRNR